MSYRLLLTLVLGGLAALFVVQNVAVVEVRFLSWSFAMSRSLLVFLMIAIGIIIGWVLHGFVRRRRRRF